MKVVTFGELMIRLQPFNYERFVQANNLEFTFGGGEANVAVSLANYGLDAAYVTKVPAHEADTAVIERLRYAQTVLCLHTADNGDDLFL